MPQTNKSPHDVNEKPTAEAKPAEVNPHITAASVEPNGESTLASKAATAAVIGLSVALIEAELIPGMLIGAAAVIAPDWLPKVGKGLRPVVKGLIRAGYTVTERAREMAAEATEQLQDIAAEVKAEQKPAAPAAPGSARP